MRVAFVTPEIVPWCKTGGLADATGALARALARLGLDVHVFVPLYGAVRARLAELGASLGERGEYAEATLGLRRVSGLFRSLRTASAEPTFHFLENHELYDRPGLYGPPHGGDHGDNARRFAFLCAASVEAAWSLLGMPPDLWHVHDWQTALVPKYLRGTKTYAKTPCVLSLHNLAYQGVFAKDQLFELGLDWGAFTFAEYEHYDKVNVLKGGIANATAIVAVSPSYASEILTSARGEGLDGALAARAHELRGILNGIDEREWDPARDPHIAAPYDATDLTGKRICREALHRELGLPADDGTPLIGVVARFAHQKGIDLLADVIPGLGHLGARVAILGVGDRGLEDRLRSLAGAAPDRIAIRVGFDAGLAHRIEAGSDLFAMPSRFEPCGLNQMYSMRYGTPPIAHATGGLRDTIVDATADAVARGEGTGFLFHEPTAGALYGAIARAVTAFRDHPLAFARIIRAGMKRSFGWEHAAAQYASLYRELVAIASGATASPS